MIPKLPQLLKGISFDNEKKFQEWFIKSLRVNGWWAYKLPDTGYDFKPFDLVAIKDSVTLFVELKVTPSETISCSSLRANQKFALKEVESKGGLALVIIYSKKTQTYEAFRFSEFIEASSIKGKPLKITEQIL